ncbi:RNA-directed DNA polymerase [Pseudomonas sp.]|uniref:RNA-directed DNA polymerase n=1 Tax=Pseudomonas sp. TaxID=306 RepID=UPI0031DEAC22
MAEVTLQHFLRAAADIGAHGDNDTLPFDVDTNFVSARQHELAQAAFSFSEELRKDSEANNKKKITAITVFSERLLVATGASGFRVTTKLHPFWSIYFNGLGVAIADQLEPIRDKRAFSYRFQAEGGSDLFDRSSSWRLFRESTSKAAALAPKGTVVVQTDISSFYEHISHHYLENLIDDLFPDKKVGNQVTALLSKFSAGRSFGLPVGGQCSRILAELFLNSVDHRMTQDGLQWYRYVDDYVLIAESNSAAYAGLAFLSHTLADYGITLNKSKTIMMTAKHYQEFVTSQLGGDDTNAGILRHVDLHYDPYSDNPEEDYESLKNTVEKLDIQKLLGNELQKSLPDNFLITQIGRTLTFHSPVLALQLASTLLEASNLHAFRASWATIMRGVTNLRASAGYKEIHAGLDAAIDRVATQSVHLLQAEASLLHYLRVLKFAQTPARAAFIQKIHNSSSSNTIKRACIECWRQWKDRSAFSAVGSRWNEINPECQRLMWLAADSFGDQGEGLRRQVGPSLDHSWRLGIERQGCPSFANLYRSWCDED